MKKAAAVIAALAGGGFLLWTSRPSQTGEARGLASIRVPEGFTVELAAKPGIVNYPMLGTIAPDGSIYMSESSGRTMKTPEMSADPNYVVTKIVDTDGDGVYDKSTVFADRLTLPAGAVFHRGSLYVAAPPKLLRLEDLNGDGVADVRETIVEGWNLSANAASLHGPIMGPDGYLYLTDGRHGFKIKTRDGRSYEGKASRIWRVRPDGTGLEPFAGGGFDNPVEIAFSDGGDLFATMTYYTDPRDGQRDAILHFVEGGVYPKPHPSIDEFKRTGDLMPVMTRFARVAPAGLLRYRGDGFGPGFHGNLFTAHFNSHRVLRHRLTRSGATYKTEDSDFWVSSDPDIHPTDVMQDADGSLIVVDTGAWFIHGCPLSRVSKPDIRGMLYRVRRKGAPAVDDPRGTKIQTLTAGHLDDPRPVVRDRALEALSAAGEAAVASLQAQRVSARTTEGAASAVFALARIGTAPALEAVRAALDDARPEVRQAAARMLGMARDRAAVPSLIRLLSGGDAAVRRQAATALGQIGDRAAVPALIGAAASPEDRFVEHAIIYSLIQIGDSAALLPKLTDASPAVRKAALVALDQMDRSPLREQHVLPFVNDADPELRRTSLWVVSRHPSWSGRFVAALDARLRSPQFNDAEAEMIGEAMAAFCDDGNLRKSAGQSLGDPSLDSRRQLFLLGAAERCSSKNFPEEWTAGLERLLGHSDPKVRVAAIGLARARGVSALDASLRALASRAAEPDDVRVAALSALGSRHPGLSAADFAYLTSRLEPKVEANTKLAAAQVLSRSTFSEPQLLEVAEKVMKSADPLVLPNLLEAFRAGGSETAGMAFVKALGEVEASLGSIGSQRVQELVRKFPAAVQSAAAPLVARLEAGRAQRLEKLKRLEATALSGGDIRRGREVFFGAKAGCSGCHTIGLEGGHVGPDLTSIGAIRSPHDILEAIVLPSESFVPGHEIYRVETAREVYSGLMGNSTAEAIRLITGPNDEVRIPRKEVTKVDRAPVSLMPEGFDETLSAAEMTDLMAFLRAQTRRPDAAAGMD